MSHPAISSYMQHSHYSDLVQNSGDIDADDLQTLHHIAGVRFNLIYSKTTFELIVYSVEYRFLELKMLIYQWRSKALVLSFLTEEQRLSLRLAQRVISQFKEYLFQLTDYRPSIPSGVPTDKSKKKKKKKKSGDSSKENASKPLTEKQELTATAVSLVSDCLLVIEVFERRIENDGTKGPVSTKDTKNFPLTDVMRWYEKLTFFMKTIVKAIHFKEKTTIIIYQKNDPGRIDSQFENARVLPSIFFEEIESPQQKLERICKDAYFPPIPKDFNDKEIKEYFSKKWQEIIDDPETMIYDSSVQDAVPLHEYIKKPENKESLVSLGIHPQKGKKKKK